MIQEFIIENWVLLTTLITVIALKIFPSNLTTDVLKWIFKLIEMVWGFIPDNASGGGKFVMEVKKKNDEEN